MCHLTFYVCCRKRPQFPRNSDCFVFNPIDQLLELTEPRLWRVTLTKLHIKYTHV